MLVSTENRERCWWPARWRRENDREREKLRCDKKRKAAIIDTEGQRLPVLE
jgi:hypothetical protein